MTIGLGTDGIGDGFGVHQQLASYTQCGLTPREAIVSATGTNAKILGLDKMGTVAAGRKPTSSFWTRTIGRHPQRGASRMSTERQGSRSQGSRASFMGAKSTK